jgi:aspartate aminotransferase
MENATKQPELSEHFKERQPSAIRMAQIEHMKRTDGVPALNTAIGNVSLPMHPAMIKRMHNLNVKDYQFKDGVVRYSATVGFEETNKAFLNVIASSGFEIERLYSQITNGGSQAMELLILGVCGPAGSSEKPLLLIDAAYTNYTAMAQRLGRKTVSIRRELLPTGKFSLPAIEDIESIILKHDPGAMVVIPYDNPTGHFYDHKTMVGLAGLCAKHNLWMVSDEAYRELHYVDQDAVSIWGLDNKEVPGIEGRRISIETSSKVWNACGLRIGALVTDNKLFHQKAVAENTADLCSNVIGQYIFGAIAHEKKEDLQQWYAKQRSYYKAMLDTLTKDMKTRLPGIIVSSPDASIYSVVDVRDIAKPGFDAQEFVMYCASKGKVKVAGVDKTLLVSPMAGFYNVDDGEPNPGKTQMRIAYVETPENMRLVPQMFAELFRQFEGRTR